MEKTDILKGKTFSIDVFGCRTNQYEAEAITFALERAGAIYSDKDADISLLLSCSITEVAERKCRKTIRRRVRENKATITVVCGCYAQKISEKELKKMGINILIGSRLKHKVAEIIADHIFSPNETSCHIISEKELLKDVSWDSLILDRPRHRSRAFLKIQDGCNHFCSYCIVPYVRGYPVSRDFEETVSEARRIVESGCPEIVVTGIHLGLYERLPALIRCIGEIEGLERLRFGSIEPFAVTEELLYVLSETESFCHHLHMPLQSGDDEVLNLMRRGYTTDDFRRVVDRVRNVLGEEVHISTDFMLGFPGERDSAFKNSIKFLREIRFGKVHVFPYSRRPGTAAATLPLLHKSVIKERKGEALVLAEDLLEAYCKKAIGKKTSILVEERKLGKVSGLTPTFIRLYKDDNLEKILDIVEVTPSSYKNGSLYVDLLSETKDTFGLE